MNLDIKAHLNVDHEIEFHVTRVRRSAAEAFRGDHKGESNVSIVEVWQPIAQTETDQVYCKTCDVFLTGDWRVI